MTVDLKDALPLIALSTACVLALPAAPGAAAPAGEADRMIAGAVAERLRLEPNFSGSDIGVAVEEGVARITGSAATLFQRELASDIAHATRGVRSVVNLMAVETRDIPDPELRKAVTAALAGEPAVDANDIEVAVSGGQVTLSGEVASVAEARLAVRACQQVGGATAVIDELSVEPPLRRADGEILEDVRRVLETDVWITPDFLEVDVTDRKVTVGGLIGSPAERARVAQRAAVAGAKAVDVDRLKVDPFVRGYAKKPVENVVMPASQIRDALAAAFAADPRIDAEEIELTVDGGTVRLGGQAGSLRSVRAAERIARHTFGVREVVNELALRPRGAADDTELAEDIKAALGRSAITQPGDIDVRVEGGGVTLEGAVQFPFESDLAEDIALTFESAASIENRLDADRSLHAFRPHLSLDRSFANPGYRFLVAEGAEADAELERAIQTALDRSPIFERGQIQVDVASGKVRLTGKAASERTRGAAAILAGEFALEVENDVDVAR